MKKRCSYYIIIFDSLFKNRKTEIMLSKVITTSSSTSNNKSSSSAAPLEQKQRLVVAPRSRTKDRRNRTILRAKRRQQLQEISSCETVSERIEYRNYLEFQKLHQRLQKRHHALESSLTIQERLLRKDRIAQHKRIDREISRKYRQHQQQRESVESLFVDNVKERLRQRALFFNARKEEELRQEDAALAEIREELHNQNVQKRECKLRLRQKRLLLIQLHQLEQKFLNEEEQDQLVCFEQVKRFELENLQKEMFGELSRFCSGCSKHQQQRDQQQIVFGWNLVFDFVLYIILVIWKTISRFL